VGCSYSNPPKFSFGRVSKLYANFIWFLIELSTIYSDVQINGTMEIDVVVSGVLNTSFSTSGVMENTIALSGVLE
jgi:hypothetical protein